MPEGRHLFPYMTVLENLEMGGFTRKGCNLKAEAEAILELFPILKDKRKMRAGGLSTGEQQLLALGRALMQKPRLLLAEEPARGFSWGG